MTAYDPAIAPDAAEWLTMEQPARIAAVAEFHRVNRIEIPRKDRVMHSAVHAIVETQIASNDPPEVGAAMTRLTAAGMDRHEALHALGATLARHMFALSRDEDASAGEHAKYREAVAALSFRSEA